MRVFVRRRAMRKIRCERCGREVVLEGDEARTNRRFCHECSDARKSEKNRERRAADQKEMSEILDDAWECSWNYPMVNEIRRAKTKPSGMSDVAWRIELRRRRDQGYYEKFGDSP